MCQNRLVHACVVSVASQLFVSSLYISSCKKACNYCIHRIASGGYYGFHFVTPPQPLRQCVERFHHYHSYKKNIIASLLKFAGYLHNHKIWGRNIFGLILKNKMATTGVFFFLLSARTFVGPLEQRVL